MTRTKLRTSLVERAARVYPAEKDPRQAPTFEQLVERVVERVGTIPMTGMATRGFDATLFFDRPAVDTTESLAREFGPWVRAADGSWMRRKARRRK